MRNSRDTDLTDRSAVSRLLYSVDRSTGRPLVALTVVVADLLWVLFSVFNGFPGRLETVFQAVVAALTLAMVFVIQHTQARHQVTTQRKLDEILRALPHADNSIIALEDADDETLRSTHNAHRDLRREALGHAG
jgi:low affinity Fe/Cu permease